MVVWRKGMQFYGETVSPVLLKPFWYMDVCIKIASGIRIARRKQETCMNMMQ